MRLAVFYAVVSISYLALARVDFHTSQVVVPFVVALLLAPAVYSEFLRVRGGRRARP